MGKVWVLLGVQASVVTLSGQWSMKVEQLRQHLKGIGLCQADKLYVPAERRSRWSKERDGMKWKEARPPEREIYM